jgi:periplasmic copper chaperone A
MRLAALTLVFFLLAPAAWAHVTVLPASARPGQTPALHFRVLNERSDARTVEIDIFVPRGLHATASDRRGWRLVDKPGEFDWVARDAGIGGADAKDFELRVGPLPHARQVVFKALQHYSDGQIVRWIQTSAGAERPAPVLQLGSAPSAGGGGSSGAGFLVPVAVVVLLLGGGLMVRRFRR